MPEQKVSLKPFSVPNYVSAEAPPRSMQDGWIQSPSFHLSELDPEALSDLCDEFRGNVFAKAEKDDPRHAEKESDHE